MSGAKVYPRRPGQSGAEWFAEMSNPHAWLMTADNLFEQCVRLHAQKGRGTIGFKDSRTNLVWDVVDRSMFLIGGFALENAIKAFVVYDNPELIADGRLARPLLSHKLGKLIDLSKSIPMPVRGKKIVAPFENGLETWSRYPCGKDINDTDHQRWMTPELWSLYCDLMRRYGRRLEALLTKGWTGPHNSGGKWTFNEFHFLDVDHVKL